MYAFSMLYVVVIDLVKFSPNYGILCDWTQVKHRHAMHTTVNFWDGRDEMGHWVTDAFNFSEKKKKKSRTDESMRL